MSPIRIYLLIRNRLLRGALCRLLKRQADFRLAGQSDPEDPLLEEGLVNGCDVLLMDSMDEEWMPESGGRKAAEGESSELRTVLIGMEGDAGKFLEAVRRGAQGYLLKDASAGEVTAAVRSVMRGEAVCPPAMCNVLFKTVAGETRVERKREGGANLLTLRQQKLMGLVARGLTNKEIAAELNLSEFTVRNHIHRILKQLDAESRGEAVQVALASGYAMRG